MGGLIRCFGGELLPYWCRTTVLALMDVCRESGGACLLCGGWTLTGVTSIYIYSIWRHKLRRSIVALRPTC